MGPTAPAYLGFKKNHGYLQYCETKHLSMVCLTLGSKQMLTVGTNISPKWCAILENSLVCMLQ